MWATRLPNLGWIWAGRPPERLSEPFSSSSSSPSSPHNPPFFRFSLPVHGAPKRCELFFWAYIIANKCVRLLSSQLTEGASSLSLFFCVSYEFFRKDAWNLGICSDFGAGSHTWAVSKTRPYSPPRSSVFGLRSYVFLSSAFGLRYSVFGLMSFCLRPSVLGIRS
jgi:hypothetical protein